MKTWSSIAEIFDRIVETDLAELDRLVPGPATMPRGRNGKRKRVPPGRYLDHLTPAERASYHSGAWLG